MMIHSTIKKPYTPGCSPHKKTQKTCVFYIKIMQNEPNLNNSDHQLTACMSMSYAKSALSYVKKTNPIRTQNEPNSNPIIGKRSQPAADYLALPSAKAVINYVQSNICMNVTFIRSNNNVA